MHKGSGLRIDYDMLYCKHCLFVGNFVGEPRPLLVVIDEVASNVLEEKFYKTLI